VKMTEKPGVHIGNIKGYKVPKNPLKNVASVAVNALLKSHPTKNGFIISIEKGIISKVCPSTTLQRFKDNPS